MHFPQFIGSIALTLSSIASAGIIGRQEGARQDAQHAKYARDVTVPITSTIIEYVPTASSVVTRTSTIFPSASAYFPSAQPIPYFSLNGTSIVNSTTIRFTVTSTTYIYVTPTQTITETSPAQANTIASANANANAKAAPAVAIQAGAGAVVNTVVNSFFSTQTINSVVVTGDNIDALSDSDPVVVTAQQGSSNGPNTEPANTADTNYVEGVDEDDWPNHTVTGYYDPRRSDVLPPANVSWQYLTHLAYIANQSVALINDSILLNVSSHAKANNVRLILSVPAADYRTNSTINAFVASLANSTSLLGITGISIDMDINEPTTTLRKRQFNGTETPLTLLRAIRRTLPNLELSAALTGSRNQANGTFALAPLTDILDRVYLRGYNLWQGKTTAGSNGALASNTLANPLQDSGLASLQRLLSDGVPLSKVIYGVASYGNVYQLANSSLPTITALYSNVTSLPATKVPWRDIKLDIANSTINYTVAYDGQSLTPFAFNSTSILSYDDADSITIKRLLARINGLSGMMLSDLAGDTADAELLQALN